MKKPDYCPDWFDIDLYDNLAHQPRDALAFALWSRRMDYKGYFSDIERYREGGDNGDITEEALLKYHALEWLKMMATQWNVEPVKYRGSHQVKESYDPLGA